VKSRWIYPINRWIHGKQTKEPALRPELEIYLNRRGGNGSNVWAISQTAQKKIESQEKRVKHRTLGNTYI